MSETQMAVKVNGADTLVSLAQLAELDVSGFDAFRGSKAPVGVFHWRVKECDLKEGEFNDWDANDGTKVMRAYIQLGLEAVNVMSLADKTLNPADYIGTEHGERIIIIDVQKDVGRFIALLEDSAFTYRGGLQAMCQAFQGHEFLGGVKHRKSKTDADVSFANLDWNNVKPVPGAVPAAPPAAVAADLPGAPAAPAPAAPAAPPAAPTAPAAPAAPAAPGGINLGVAAAAS